MNALQYCKNYDFVPLPFTADFTLHTTLPYKVVFANGNGKVAVTGQNHNIFSTVNPLFMWLKAGTKNGVLR
jgi:hypothetical protein